MSLMRTVELPDGSALQFPPDISEAEIAAVIGHQFAPSRSRQRQVERFGVFGTAEEQDVTIVPDDARADFFSRNGMPRVLRRAPR